MPEGEPSQLRLSYDEAGSGEPAVVLLHGWGFGNRSHLLPQFEHLATERRVILLDLPGHGGSDPGTATGSLDEKTITLDIQSRLRTLLEANGFDVVVTRSDDRLIALRERARLIAAMDARLAALDVLAEHEAVVPVAVGPERPVSG